MKHSQNDLKRKRDERNGCDTFHKCDYSKSAVQLFLSFFSPRRNGESYVTIVNTNCSKETNL